MSRKTLAFDADFASRPTPRTEKAAQHRRLEYRPDVEGLRAVAILLVVAAHAKVPGFSGGFVGVDVFFVLSGYLITGLLVTELRTSRSIRFIDFYARRLGRLLPALLLMTTVTCAAAWILIAPGDQPSQASSAASALLWFSNFHFAFAEMDYFSPGTESDLFLHTWSLGVEEQFYLCWPLLLALAAGAWLGSAEPPNERRVLWTLLLTLLISLTTSAVACMAVRTWRTRIPAPAH